MHRRHTPAAQPIDRQPARLPLAWWWAWLACALLLSAQPAAAQAGDGVHPFKARYEGKKRVALVTATARAVIELRRSSRYVLYTMHTQVRWALIERHLHDCSVMRIDSNGSGNSNNGVGSVLRPIEYRHIDESQPQLDVHTRFDWAANRATTTVGGAAPALEAAIDSSTWDPMSFQVALMALAQRQAPGAAQAHRIIERGVVRDHQVRFVGPVQLTGLPGLPPQAPVYEVTSQKGPGSKLSLYLLPEQGWRPVRVTVDDITIDAVSGAAAAAPAPLAEGEVPSCEPAALRARTAGAAG